MWRWRERSTASRRSRSARARSAARSSTNARSKCERLCRMRMAIRGTLAVAGAPQAAAGLVCPAGQRPEPVRVADVGRDRQRHRVAQADQLGVHEHAAGAYVGEQPAVAVAFLDIELEPHAAALDEPGVGGRRLLGEALDRRVRLDRLRRVDADVADLLAAAVDADVDRVAVDDPDDAALERPAGG